jgi:hypothetical protein
MTCVCLYFTARPGADVDSYLRSLERVQDAIEFFERNNPNSPELSLLVSLNNNRSNNNRINNNKSNNDNNSSNNVQQDEQQKQQQQ